MDFFAAHPEHGWLLLLGCAFCPRFVIAILALAYWPTNPFLVVLAWLFAFGSGVDSANESRVRITRARAEG